MRRTVTGWWKEKKDKKPLLPLNICKLSRLHKHYLSSEDRNFLPLAELLTVHLLPKEPQRRTLASRSLSLSLTFFCTFSPFSEGVTCSSRPTSPSPPRTTIMHQKRMSSLNWSSASNRARNEKGKDLLGLVGNQARKKV